MLLDAMDGRLPTRAVAHRTSVTPGPANRGDIAGDGPPPVPVALPDHLAHPGLPKDHPMWADLLEAMYRKWSSLRNVPRIAAHPRDFGDVPGEVAHALRCIHQSPQAQQRGSSEGY